MGLYTARSEIPKRTMKILSEHYTHLTKFFSFGPGIGKMRTQTKLMLPPLPWNGGDLVWPAELCRMSNALFTILSPKLLGM